MNGQDPDFKVVVIIFISLLIISLIFFSVTERHWPCSCICSHSRSDKILFRYSSKRRCRYVFALITFLTLMHRSCSIPRVCASVVSNNYLNYSVSTYWPYTFYNVTAIKPNNTSLFTPFLQNFFELIIIIYCLFKPKCNFLFVQRTSFFFYFEFFMAVLVIAILNFVKHLLAVMKIFDNLLVSINLLILTL